jgi:predicted anti-sigma-YlaC factor YlaD
MSVSCAEIRALWNAYAEEALEPAQRRAVREHLARCESCRDRAACVDPGLLFSRVPARPASDEDIESVLAGVRAGIAWKQAERRLAKRPLRIWASVAVMIALVLLLPGSRTRRATEASTGDRPASPASVEASSSPAALPVEASDPKTSLPANATIYDWTTGTGQPRVVWIVDRSLDI